MNHITTTLIKSIYLAKLDLHAETGRRIEISPSILKRFEEVSELEHRRNHPQTPELTFNRDALERNFKRACEFEMKIFINDDGSNIIDGVLVDQQDDFEEIFEEIRKAAQSEEAWQKVSGFSLLTDAIKQHPYFYLKD